MKRLRGFPPIADRRARVLVLGSMPGEASLAANEYYAFRHNQFWRIAGELAGFAHDAPYARRTAALRRCRIALWDVVASCVRPGSLDSAIREDSHPRQRLRRLPRGAPGDPPRLLQRPQGRVRLAPPRRADAPRDAGASSTGCCRPRARPMPG